jgi:hypothetical protein
MLLSAVKHWSQARFSTGLAMLLALSLYLLFPNPVRAQMKANEAMTLIQAWGSSVGDSTYVGRMKTSPDGSFETRAKGAIFRYSAAESKLRVSGIVSFKALLYFPHSPTLKGLTDVQRERRRSNAADYQAEITRLGKQRQKVMGDGQFDFVETSISDLPQSDFPAVFLSKDFRNAAIAPNQFTVEVRWLLAGAYYWFISNPPHGQISLFAVTPEEEAKATAEIERDFKPRPW